MIAVHISDIHFGSKISGRGAVPRATGHELRVLEALYVSLGRLFQSEPDETFCLLISGDVTATGEPAELSMYRTLLLLGFQLDAYASFGALAEGFQSVLDIPGNHDYWNGKILNPNLNPNLRARYFSPEPWALAMKVGSYEVIFHGLCSTAGASPRQQVMAVGEIHVDDQNRLRASISRFNASAATSGRRAFHIVVTHHSPSAGSTATHGLGAASANWLMGLGAPPYGVRALLTGHAHSTHLDLTPQGRIPEARCATSLQWNHPLLPSQSREFLVHRFADMGQRLWWHVVPWVFTGSRFVPVPSAESARIF